MHWWHASCLGSRCAETYATHQSASWGRYNGGRRPLSDNSFHSPTVIPPTALDKPSIMKRYHRRWTCSHTSPRRSPTMVTLHDTRFVECQWWNDGWTVKTVITWRSSASMIQVPDLTEVIMDGNNDLWSLCGEEEGRWRWKLASNVYCNRQYTSKIVNGVC